VAAAINAAACELTRVYVLLKPTGRKPVDGCQEVVQGVNVDLEPNVDDLEADFIDPVDHRVRFLAPIFLAPKNAVVLRARRDCEDGHSIRQSRKKNHPSALTRAMVVMLSGFVSVPGAQIYYETYTPEHTQQKQPDVQTLMCTPVGRTHTHSHTPLA
jgi:hypothetical protein